MTLICQRCGGVGIIHHYDCNPDFDGATYDRQRDQPRLRRELDLVQAVMSSVPGKWWTLDRLSVVTSSPEASVSARLRDLRKPKFGGHTVDRRYAGRGVWEYRYTPAQRDRSRLDPSWQKSEPWWGLYTPCPGCGTKIANHHGPNCPTHDPAASPAA